MPTALETWIAAYTKAWSSNDADDIRALFTPDAEYRTEPDAEPWVGHDEIVDGWTAAADEPGEWSFDWHAVVETETLCIVEGATEYAEGPDYNNLWIVRLAPDGRADSFTEWWMEQDAG